MSISRLIADLESRFDQERRDMQRQDAYELVVEERASISLIQRIFACEGQRLSCVLRGGEHVEGTVMDVAESWVLLDSGREETLIPLPAIAQLSSLGRAVPQSERPSLKLGVASVLRRLERESVVLSIDHDGGNTCGVIEAVYADHVDLRGSSPYQEDLRDFRQSPAVTIPISGIRKISVVQRAW